MLKRNAAEILRRIITVDETWIYHYTPETEQKSKQWVEECGSAPKRATTVSSAGKVMAPVLGICRMWCL